MEKNDYLLLQSIKDLKLFSIKNLDYAFLFKRKHFNECLVPQIFKKHISTNKWFGNEIEYQNNLKFINNNKNFEKNRINLKIENHNNMNKEKLVEPEIKNQNLYCSNCKINFNDYLKHINSANHINIIKNNEFYKDFLEINKDFNIDKINFNKECNNKEIETFKIKKQNDIINFIETKKINNLEDKEINNDILLEIKFNNSKFKYLEYERKKKLQDLVNNHYNLNSNNLELIKQKITKIKNLIK